MPNIDAGDFSGNGPNRAAFSFDGTTELARNTNGGAGHNLEISDQWTVEAWCQPLALPGSPNLAHVLDVVELSGGNPNGSRRIQLFIDSTDGNRWKARVTSSPGSSTSLRSVAAARVGEDYHLTIVKNGAMMEFWLNGVLHDSTAGAITIGSSMARSITVGAAGDVGGFFQGLMRHVALWNAPRGAASIRRTFNGGFAHLSLIDSTVEYAEAGNLRHWWRFVRPTGTFGVGGGQVNDHVIIGGINLQTNAVGLDPLIDTALRPTMMSGAGLRFESGPGDRVFNASNNVLGFGNLWSASLWIYSFNFGSMSIDQTLLRVTSGSPTHANQILFLLRADGADVFSVGTRDSGGTAQLDARWNGLFTANQWEHVLFAYGGQNDYALYHNGTLVAPSVENADTAAARADVGVEVTIGADVDDATPLYFNGILGPICFWNAELTQNAARQMFMQRFSFDPRINFGSYSFSGNLKQFWKPGGDPSSLGRSFKLGSGGVSMPNVRNADHPRRGVVVVP